MNSVETKIENSLNEGNEKFVYTCNKCKCQIETRFHCTVCEDFDLCIRCFEVEGGHEHSMEKLTSDTNSLAEDQTPGAMQNQSDSKQTDDSKSNQSNQQKSYIEMYLDTFMHAVNCRNANCTFAKCMQFKRVVQHSKQCQKFKNSQCEFCRQLITLCIYHAKSCKDEKCQVPLCNSIKLKLKQQGNTKKILEFISYYLKYLRNKNKNDSETQTLSELNDKRKFVCIDNELDSSNQNIGDLENSNESKPLLFNNLKEIEQLSLEIDENISLDKSSKLELVKFFYNLCLSELLLKTEKDSTNAGLLVYLFRKEKLINGVSKNIAEYLYSITQVFYEVLKKLESKKVFNSVYVQTDSETDCNETLDLDYPNKRFKSD